MFLILCDFMCICVTILVTFSIFLFRTRFFFCHDLLSKLLKIWVDFLRTIEDCIWRECVLLKILFKMFVSYYELRSVGFHPWTYFLRARSCWLLHGRKRLSLSITGEELSLTVPFWWNSLYSSISYPKYEEEKFTFPKKIRS